MRPLNNVSHTISNSKYLRKFLNDLDSVTDTELYFKQDYVLNKNFANRDKSDCKYLADFFQAGDKITIPKSNKKEDYQKGKNFEKKTLASNNLEISKDITLNARFLLIEKHQEKRVYYCRLLIKWNDIVKLLLLDESVTRWSKDPELKSSLPPEISDWDDLKELLIQPLKESVSNFYKDAKEELIRSYGLYCAYCDTIITDGGLLDIEHKLPKSLFPDLQADWNNFVISCKVCNSSHKQTTPNLLFGRQRILYGNDDHADITNWTFRFGVSLVPQSTLSAFTKSIGDFAKLRKKKLTCRYLPDLNKFEMSGDYSVDDKIALIKCFDSKKFEQLVNGIVIGNVSISVKFLPVPQGIYDFIGLNSTKYSYDETDGMLSIRGDFSTNDCKDWTSFFNKAKDKDTIALFEKLKETISSLKKLEKGNDVSLLDSGSLIVINQSGETLDFSYNNIRTQAKEWNLWPDDGRNTLFSIGYSCTEALLRNDKTPPANKWWVDKIANVDNYVVLQQINQDLKRLDVRALNVSPPTGTDPKLNFGTESIMKIVGINITKNDLVDGRILNRTRTWMIAKRQFNLLSTEIAQRTARQRLYLFFSNKDNWPVNPHTDQGLAKEWNENWAELAKILDDRSSIMELLLWNNLIEIVYASGFFTVWINVFKTLDTSSDKKIVKEFVNKLNERLSDSSIDPHFYRSTNTNFVNDYINS